MKKMISTIVLSLLPIVSVMSENNEKTTPHKKEEAKLPNKYGFFQLGLGPLPLLIPTVGLGYRSQNDSVGYDISLQSIIYLDYWYNICSFHLNANSKQQQNKRFYMGIGPSYTLYCDDNRYDMKFKHGFGASAIIGKQYLNDSQNNRHIQVEFFVPMMRIYDFPLIPLISVSYGWGF